MEFHHSFTTPHLPGGPIRTTGDGRENPDGAEDPVNLANKLSSICIGVKQLEPPPEDLSKLSFSPVKPVGEIVHLTPRLAHGTKQNAESSFRSMQGKEPKFVPYEPYKGAVHPIVTRKSQKKFKRNASSESVASLSKDFPALDPEIPREFHLPMPIHHADVEMRQDLTTSKPNNEVEELRRALQFQEQVNTELKRMLVAAVGEDVEVKVQHLTEDKLHLARALVNNSESITSHQEKLEYMAGQCEVWRSKFLASSLMVDELSRWKTELTLLANQLQASLGELMSENATAKESMKKTTRNLQLLRENFDPASGMSLGSPGRRTSLLPSTSTLPDISSTNLKLSESLSQRLLGYIPPQNKESATDLLPQYSPAELKALSLLQSNASTKCGINPDAACSAVVGAAAAAGCQLFPHVSCTPTACCGQCQGEMIQM